MGTKKQTLRNRLMAFAVVMVYALALLPSFALAANTLITEGAGNTATVGTVTVDNTAETIAVGVPFGTKTTAITLDTADPFTYSDSTNGSVSDKVLTINNITDQMTGNVVVAGATTETYALTITVAAATDTKALDSVSVEALDKDGNTIVTVNPTVPSASATTVVGEFGINTEAVNVTPVLPVGQISSFEMKVDSSVVANPIALAPGESKDVVVTVKAQDDSTADYTFTIKRAQGNTDTTLTSATFQGYDANGVEVGTPVVINNPATTSTDNPVEFPYGATQYEVVEAITAVGTSTTNAPAGMQAIADLTIKVTAQSLATDDYDFVITAALPDDDVAFTAFAAAATDVQWTKEPILADVNNGAVDFAGTVPFSTTTATITADAPATAKLEINGEVYTAPKTIDLNVGDNAINVLVTAQDGTTKLNNVITITRTAPQTSTEITEIEIKGYDAASAGSMVTTDKIVVDTNGEATIPFAAKFVEVLPTFEADANKATVVVSPLAAGSARVALEPGVPTKVAIAVTAEDGTTKETKEITLTRANGSTDANIKEFKASSGAGNDTVYYISHNRNDNADATFSSDVYDYTVDVPTNAGAITISNVLNDATASVKSTKLNGRLTGNTFNLLNNYKNVLEIIVTAEDGSEATYTFNFVVGEQDNDSALKTLEVSLANGTPVNISPAFSATQKYYTASVGNAVNSVMIKAEANAKGSAVRVVNSTVDANGIYTVNIAGNQRVQVIVRAEDQSVSNYYITFAQLPVSEDATVKSIALGGAWTDDAFDPKTNNYTGESATTKAQITVVPNNDYANITINNTPMIAGESKEITLNAKGTSTFKIVVKSEDGKNTSTYTYKLSVNGTFIPADFVAVANVTETSVTMKYTDAKDMTNYAVYYREVVAQGEEEAKWAYGAGAKAGVGQITVKNLQPGTNYEFKVTSGKVLYNGKVSYIPLDGITAHTATTNGWKHTGNVKIAAVNETSAQIGFLPMGGVDGYALYFRENGTEKWTYAAKGNSKVATLTAMNLDVKKSYDFVVTSGRMINGKMVYTPLASLAANTLTGVKLSKSNYPQGLKVVTGSTALKATYTGVVGVDSYAAYISDKADGTYKYVAKTVDTNEMIIPNIDTTKTHFIKVTVGKLNKNGKMVYTPLADIDAIQVNAK